jgi:hypothetical protein
MKKHLDIGCGIRPRNPYKYNLAFGLNVVPQPLSPISVTVANLALYTISFNSNEFDSISAFDFIEHVFRPRIIDSHLSN